MVLTTDNNTKGAIDALLERVDSFPTLPAITMQIMSITADPESSSKDLVTAITPDQALTTMILKMANSAFFGMSHRVSSIQNAITVLGFRAIRNVVLARSVFESFDNMGFAKQFDIRTFWEHSFLCALAATVIAEKLKTEKSEFFVAGLIHDIGKLIIYMTFPKKFFQIVELAGSAGPEFYEAEQKILGITHDELAMALLGRWLFPENLVEAVGFHHRPKASHSQSRFSSAIFAADFLAHASGTKENTIRTETLNTLHSLGMNWDKTDIEDLFRKLQEKKEEEAETLHILLS